MSAEEDKSPDHTDGAYFEKEVWTLQRAIKKIDTERRAEPDFPKQGSYLDDFLLRNADYIREIPA